MHDAVSAALLALFTLFVAAQIGAEIAQRLRLPAVVGEIAAGCLIGPSVFAWVRPSEPMEVLAEIGAVLLLFSVGMETRLGDLRKVGKQAALVGALGVAVPFVLGVAWARYAGFDTPRALFVAAAFVATSAGITARVLKDLNALGRIESRVILGAAVIDDILAMLLLGVVTALQPGQNGAPGGGGVNFLHLSAVLIQAVAFVFLIAVVGTRFMQKRSSVLDAPINPLSPLTLSLAVCLGLAALAAKLGLAAIIGAFLAGMAVAEARQRRALEKQLQPLLAFLVPLFFVVTGTKVDVRALASLPVLASLVVITVLAVLGKLIGCGLGARSLGVRSALIVGVGMIPRGEVGIIVASLGRSANVFNDETYALIIAMSLLTSVIAPPMLGKLLANAPPAPAEASAPPDEDDVPYLLTDVDESGNS